MAFDYKKEYKEFYIPKNKPSIVTVPSGGWRIQAGDRFAVRNSVHHKNE